MVGLAHWVTNARSAGEAVGVASARLCSNVSNYCGRPAMCDAYGLRTVALGRLPPSGRYPGT